MIKIELVNLASVAVCVYIPFFSLNKIWEICSQKYLRVETIFQIKLFKNDKN